MTGTDTDQALLAFARETIEAAGSIALRYFRTPMEIENKSGHRKFDPVTRADREIEEFIRGRISAAYPGHSIVGEEAAPREGHEGFRWFIDPIDGTKAFISGVPAWGILLGLMEEDACLFGLVHQPFLRETYLGSKQGAYLCRDAESYLLRTRDTMDLKDAVLYCTHPDMFQAETDLPAFRRVAERCKLMRFGGDCYSYCLLAYGFIDLVIEAGLNRHDIIPLIPIIEAAGGRVTDWSGGNAAGGGRIVAAGNRRLHEQALDLLRQRMV
jgi:myo-inositol-1(or 4)-monophosphatase